jgi:hypothetical protein
VGFPFAFSAVPMLGGFLFSETTQLALEDMENNI